MALLSSIIALTCVVSLGYAGSPCPPPETIRPCFCSLVNQKTTVVCSNIENDEQLTSVTRLFGGMIIDRFILLNLFKAPRRLPNGWLSSVRVRELEIRDSKLSHNSYLHHDYLNDQDDFLTSLVVTHSNLQDKYCSENSYRFRTVSNMQNKTKLNHVDYSFNEITSIKNCTFLPPFTDLKTIDLSHNFIKIIHDDTFYHLSSLTELNLSHNKLNRMAREIFNPTESSLEILDLSWNFIRNFPVDMFQGLFKLRELKVNHNLLGVLDANVWKWLGHRVERLDVEGNLINCNCNLSWISQTKHKAMRVFGKCALPSEVQLREIESIMSDIKDCSA